MTRNQRFRPFHLIVAAVGEFDISFEGAAEALAQIDRLFFEPDGSFVWAGESWQLDGVLYDRAGRVAYLELKGAAPIAALERLIAAVGWPSTEFTFQLVQEGQTLDEAGFRKWLADAPD